MDRKRCASSFVVTDGMEAIKVERNRLEKIVASKEFASNRQWRWMLPWLEKTDEQHLIKKMTMGNWANEDGEEIDREQDRIDDAYCCAICFTPHRFLLVSEFSFCDEYSCGIRICRDCAIKLGDLAKTMPTVVKND